MTGRDDSSTIAMPTSGKKKNPQLAFFVPSFHFFLCADFSHVNETNNCCMWVGGFGRGFLNRVGSDRPEGEVR